MDKRTNLVRSYERGNIESSSHCSASISGVATSAPKSTSGPTCQRIIEKCPSLARKMIPETVQELEARKATPGETCSGRNLPEVTLCVYMRFAPPGQIKLLQTPPLSPPPPSPFLTPTYLPFPSAYPT